MRQADRWLRWGATLALALLGANPVQAQESVTLNQFRPAERVDDAFALSRPTGQGHLRFGAQLHLDYANDPLVYQVDLAPGPSSSTPVVAHQLVGTLGLSLGLHERYVIFAGLPVSFYQDGEDLTALGVPGADDPGFGDLVLGARARLLGDRRDDFALAAQLTVTLPSGGGHYRGDDWFSAHVELLAEVRPETLRLTANLGLRVADAVTVAEDTTIGSALTFALGLTAPLYGDYRDPSSTRLDLHLQLFGSSSLASFFARGATPVEILAGAKANLPSGVAVGLAGGAGVTSGFGSPDGRVVFTLGYERPSEVVAAPEEEAAPVADRDGDGVPDAADVCPNASEDADGFEDEDGCPEVDNDRDGVPDARDRCRDEAEDADGFEDEDGCPDPDNDGDGVMDADDGCPGEVEDADGFEDEDGCPDPDNDGDGVMDADDGCPGEAEDADGFEEEDGCPDPDNDGDGVLDRFDNCPTEAGTAEHRGCLRPQRVALIEWGLEIRDAVRFANNSDRLLRPSFPLLDEVARVLASHPEIRLVVVEGHTDDRGDDAANLALSQRRAEAVVAYLVERGVARERLRARGFGETRPLAPNDTARGRARNRRVVFRIVAPGASDGGSAGGEAAAPSADAPDAAGAEIEADAADAAGVTDAADTEAAQGAAAAGSPAGAADERRQAP